MYKDDNLTFDMMGNSIEVLHNQGVSPGKIARRFHIKAKDVEDILATRQIMTIKQLKKLNPVLAKWVCRWKGKGASVKLSFIDKTISIKDIPFILFADESAGEQMHLIKIIEDLVNGKTDI